MFDKVIEVGTQSSVGDWFAEAIDITPRGGGLQKIAGDLHPEVASLVAGLRPDPRYQYVLMTPLGSFEFWGMNSNGDIFPGISLSYDLSRDCGGEHARVAQALEQRWLAPFGKRLPPGNYTNFGFKTFEQAHLFRHHSNKDPARAYGDIPLAVWNGRMHRVEVIARHDREKAKREGAEEIVRDYDEGKSRSISMGCKVPFDVCTICGHISRTAADYCSHLRMSMGSVSRDGRVVGAVNFFPRFFDLSDVIIPAAKEAGTLMKVASSRRASLRKHAQPKQAEVSKKVLPNTGAKLVRKISESDPDLSETALSAGSGLRQLLTTLAGMGIVLKPHEFQFSALHHAGEPGLARQFARDRMVFSPVRSGIRMPLPPSGFSSSLARMLSPLLRPRSGMHPHLPARVLRITVIAPAQKHASVPNTPGFQKIAQAYDSYRNAVEHLPQLLNRLVDQHIDFYSEHFFSDMLTDQMAKTAAQSDSNVLPDEVFALYFYNAHRPEISRPLTKWEMDLNPTSPARALLRPGSLREIQ